MRIADVPGRVARLVLDVNAHRSGGLDELRRPRHGPVSPTPGQQERRQRARQHKLFAGESFIYRRLIAALGYGAHTGGLQTPAVA